MKNKLRTIIFFAIMLMLCLYLPCKIYADYDSEMTGLITSQEGATDSTNASGNVTSVLAVIITITRVVGVTVAVVMLLVIAMKYMSAAPSEKADIKKSAVAYVVGALVLFGAVGILTIISNFSESI